MSSGTPITLSCGTPALIRPIRPTDADSLQLGLKRLSPEGRAYRFLHSRSRFSDKELHFLTHCDNIDHFALILTILDESGHEQDAVGVTRFIRDKKIPTQAEVAIVLVDEWQRRGGGTQLLAALADIARQAGITHWQTFSLLDNAATPRLLAHTGSLTSQRRVGQGLIESLYQL